MDRAAWEHPDMHSNNTLFFPKLAKALQMIKEYFQSRLFSYQ
jgi:hypothetical protein